MSLAVFNIPLRPTFFASYRVAHPAKAATDVIGHIMYGDEERTRISLSFGYGCISLYTAALTRAYFCSLGGF